MKKKNKLKIDLGCGGLGTKFDDFIGIDIHPAPPQLRNPIAPMHLFETDIVIDDLPFEKESADEIICFHVIEHFDGTRVFNGHRVSVFSDGYDEAIALFSKIWQMLKFGGKAFVTCPDSLLFADMYVQAARGSSIASSFFERKYKTGVDFWPGDTTLKRFFTSMIDKKDHGHRTPYDLETLLSTVTKAIPGQYISVMPDAHRWRTRDHEVGIIIHKKQ